MALAARGGRESLAGTRLAGRDESVVAAVSLLTSSCNLEHAYVNPDTACPLCAPRLCARVPTRVAVLHASA